MARTSQPTLLLTLTLLLLLLFHATTTTASALANPDPEPTPFIAKFIAARQATATPAPSRTTTCTSTGFNSANSITTATGQCVVQACQTPTVDANGRAMTNTGLCTVVGIGAAAARATAMPMGVAGVVGLGAVVYGAM